MSRNLHSKAAIEEALAQLLRTEFDLAYLALLTVEGVKPASRWEKPLEAHTASPWPLWATGACLICVWALPFFLVFNGVVVIHIHVKGRRYREVSWTLIRER